MDCSCTASWSSSSTPALTSMGSLISSTATAGQSPGHEGGFIFTFCGILIDSPQGVHNLQKFGKSVMEAVLQRSTHGMRRNPAGPGRLQELLGVVGVTAALAAPAIATAQSAAPPKRPNIVIILGDDLGFADMGSFGSEIQTPNLDSLARDGVRFANFYTHASCSPTRSMLLSGVDTHVNGMGNMDE